MATQPFLSFLTPTYRRPARLAACIASVQAQTVPHLVEQVVVPDFVGVGVGGMFASIPRYAAALHGQYVHILCDDDVLADPAVVEDLQRAAMAHGFPPVMIAKARKGGSVWPTTLSGPPMCGAIDLACVFTRADIWQDAVAAYEPCYEGDYHHVRALWDAGHAFTYLDRLCVIGDVSRGAADA